MGVNHIDRHIRMVYTESGPEYWNADIATTPRA
jgi:hypothetical protein